MSIPCNISPLGILDTLPPDYTRLAFLQSTGAQYINTKATGNETSEVLCTFERTTAAGKCVYGSGASNNLLCMFVWGDRMDALRFDWIAHQKTYPGTYPGGMVTTVQSARGVTLNGKQIVEPFPEGTLVANDIILFSHKAASNAFIADNVRMARWALKNGGRPVRDMIPALDPTGTPRMYDLVTRTAYKNNGSGQFVAGVGTMAQLATLLRALPATGGTLTLSLPAEANTPEVAATLQQCHDAKGWSITVHEYRVAATATYSLRRVREVVWCRKVQSEHGSYTDPTDTRWQVERCAAIFGEHGNAPTAYGYEPFDSVEQATEYWGLSPIENTEASI